MGDEAKALARLQCLVLVLGILLVAFGAISYGVQVFCRLSQAKTCILQMMI